jgi:hypothetical protein
MAAVVMAAVVLFVSSSGGAKAWSVQGQRSYESQCASLLSAITSLPRPLPVVDPALVVQQEGHPIAVYVDGFRAELCVNTNFMGPFGSAHQRRPLDVVASEVFGHQAFALVLLTPAVRRLEVVTATGQYRTWRVNAHVAVVWITTSQSNEGLTGPIWKAEVVGLGASGELLAAQPIEICPSRREAYFNTCGRVDWQTPL